MKKVSFAIMILFIFIVSSSASDWPIYKGNIYFTGNNDEITVKNNNLKWLYQANAYVYNPIVSGSRVYFVDIKKNVYCVRKDNGRLIWRVNLRKVSSRFRSYSRAFGKIKYPLIKGNYLFLTDNIAVYCLNKLNGRVLWARTGRRNDRSMDNIRKWRTGKTNRWRPGIGKRWDPTRTSYATVDSIYANPVIHNYNIFYGTRNVFVSRDIRDGHLKWNNRAIKTYSGFPSFYDKFIFTQSMNYMTNTFTLYCMLASSGKVIWKKQLARPFKIYSPVVYKKRVYFASGKSIYCINLRTGQLLWKKNYRHYITSNPSFTEREILFTVGNRYVYMIKPLDGTVLRNIDLGRKASPYFVTIRDQIYVANNFKKNISGRGVTFTSLKSLLLTNSKKLWEFIPPFPGAAGQPVAANGIMFQPAGNYLYAVGTDYYPRIVDGGSGHYTPYGDIRPNKPGGNKPNSGNINRIKPDKTRNNNRTTDPRDKKIKMRKMKITVADKKNKRPLRGDVEIKKWHKGKLVYSKKIRIRKPNQVILVPDMNDVEITAIVPEYIPKKIIISKKDRKKKIKLDRIEKGKGFVVENIHFEFDSAYLRKESLNILDKMIVAMKRNPRIKLEVRGYTDSIGPKKYNRKLSERRADAVKDYLIKNGISPERLRAKGFGELNPRATNKTRAGRKKNRRTEFFILDR